MATTAPYPAPSKHLSTTIASTPTSATSIQFSDKIFLSLSQSGRINHWVHVPLSQPLPSDLISMPAPTSYAESGPDTSLLPNNRLTATTVLGGTRPEFEIVGTTLATTVASAVLMRNADESRTLVLGLGLDRADLDRTEFDGLVGLCLDVL